jgi:hypothetical protein
MMDANNPHMMGTVQTFKGDDTTEDLHNEFFEVVEYTPATGMVEIGWDGPGRDERRYIALPLHELVVKAAAFGRPTPD